MAAKLAVRRRVVDGGTMSSPAQSLDFIDEGKAAAVPAMPVPPNFPKREPMAQGVASSEDPWSKVPAHPYAPKTNPASNNPMGLAGSSHSSLPGVDVDDYVRASAVQRSAMLKLQKRPPTPGTPRSHTSAASSRALAKISALEKQLATAVAQKESAEAQAAEAEDYVQAANRQLQQEQLARLDAQSQASHLSQQLLAAADSHV